MMYLSIALLFAHHPLIAHAQQCFQATDGGLNGVLYNAVRSYTGGDGNVRTQYGDPIDNWCVDAVTDMSFIFQDVTDFNETIASWNVGNVVTMEGMFQGASSFNQPLEEWDIAGTVNMERMFFQASSFDQPLNKWDTSTVETMLQMFLQAESFNKPLDEWDLSSVTVLNGMFASADSFNQDLCAWGPQLVAKNDAITFGGLFDEANCAVRGLLDLEADIPGPFCGSSCKRAACQISFDIIGFFGCVLDRIFSMAMLLFD